jgi:hypothetical protein
MPRRTRKDNFEVHFKDMIVIRIIGGWLNLRIVFSGEMDGSA